MGQLYIYNNHVNASNVIDTSALKIKVFTETNSSYCEYEKVAGTTDYYRVKSSFSYDSPDGFVGYLIEPGFLKAGFTTQSFWLKNGLTGSKINNTETFIGELLKYSHGSADLVIDFTPIKLDTLSSNQLYIEIDGKRKPLFTTQGYLMAN